MFNDGIQSIELYTLFYLVTMNSYMMMYCILRCCTVIKYIVVSSVNSRDSHSTVVAFWTAGQQVKRSFRHLGHDSFKNLSWKPRLSQPSRRFLVQNCGLKHCNSSENKSLFQKHFSLLIWSSQKFQWESQKFVLSWVC